MGGGGGGGGLEVSFVSLGSTEPNSEYHFCDEREAWVTNSDDLKLTSVVRKPSGLAKHYYFKLV